MLVPAFVSQFEAVLLGIRSFVIMRSKQSFFILAVLIFGKEILLHKYKMIQVIH